MHLLAKYNHSPQRLEELAYSVGGLGKDLIYWLVTAFFMLYLSLSGKCSGSFVLGLFIVGRLFDALSDPLLGYVCDLTRSRWGKFKPYLALGMILSALTTPALFYDPGFNAVAFQIYAASIFLLWTLCYTFSDIPYWALIADFGARPRIREKMAMLARLGTLLGAQLIIAVGSSVIISTPAIALRSALFDVALWTAAAFVLTQIFMLCLVQDRSLQLTPQPLKLRASLRFILSNDELLIVAAVTLCLQITVGLAHTAIFTHLASSSPALNAAALSGAVGQALSLILLLPLIKRLGRRKLFVFGALALCVGALLMCLLRLDNLQTPFTLCATYTLFSIGLALCSVLTTIMLADSVDYGEFKTGIRAEGLLFATQTMCVKFGLVLAYLISGFQAAFSALIALPTGLKVPAQFDFRLLLILSALFALFMLGLYLKRYRLHGIFFNNMLATLEFLRKPKENLSAESFTSSPTMVRYALDESCIVRHHAAGRNLTLIVEELCARLAAQGSVGSTYALMQDIAKRHEESSCAIAQGIAIAHARGSFALRPAMALCVLDQPLKELVCPDGSCCDLIFLIVAPDDGSSHLTLLGRLSLMLNEPGFADKLRQASSPHEIYARLLQCSLKITRSLE